MAKPKNPLLSLGARGTIGKALTFQKRGQDTITREKPIPAYRYTLPQAYQRWLYQDYAYLWTQQTESTKRQYAITGSPFHLTGFQYWMKYQLANLPDIVGMWHLDHITNATVIDFSKNANHGTVYGASLIKGVIDQALSFDGVDDRVDCGSSDTLKFTSSFSIQFWVKYNTLVGEQNLVSSQSATGKGFGIYKVTNVGNIRSYIKGLTPASISFPSPIGIPNVWLNLALVYDASQNKVFQYSNANQKTTNVSGTPIKSESNLFIGTAAFLAGFTNGIIDHPTIYNRALNPTQIKRHSERRYPV